MTKEIPLKIPLLMKEQEEYLDKGFWRAGRPFIQPNPLTMVNMEAENKKEREESGKDNKEYPIWYDNITDKICFAFSEDEIVLLHSLLKYTMELQEMVGTEPSEEVVELEAIFEEAEVLLDEMEVLQEAREAQ